MSARPPTADGYMCSGGKRAVLMPRFNQRVNPQTGRFCELRHKIYLNEPRSSRQGAHNKEHRPGGTGAVLEIKGLERGALKRAGSVDRCLAQHAAALVKDYRLPGGHSAQRSGEPDDELASARFRIPAGRLHACSGRNG